MPKWISRAGSTAAAGLLALSLTSCSASGGLFGDNPMAVAQVEPTTVATSAPLEYNSVFTDMGSIHPTAMIGNQLELELDMWTEQKTHEWYPDSEKLFSFVVNVYDQTVPADAPFASKRLVYMSNLTVTATTTTTSGNVETPLVLNVDPVAVTLDPEALRSDYGLLITSPKGGFQLESNAIGEVAADTEGLSLDFAMTISSESAPGSGVYVTQPVHQLVPVAIFQRS
jgi:hypothetical protein